jgi:hypothetical protein
VCKFGDRLCSTKSQKIELQPEQFFGKSHFASRDTILLSGVHVVTPRYDVITGILTVVSHDTI